MGGIVSAVTDAIGITDYGNQRAKAETAERVANEKADEQARLLDQQQKAVTAQQKAQEQELNAKKKRMAAAQSGTSGLINTNPQGQSSILG